MTAPKYTWKCEELKYARWSGWARVGPDLDFPVVIEPHGPDFILSYGFDWETGWTVGTDGGVLKFYVKSGQVGLTKFLALADEYSLREKLLEHLASRPWERLEGLLGTLVKPGRGLKKI